MCRPIEQLVDFAEQTYNPLQVIWLKDDVKQLLAREVSRETMRRNAVALAASQTSSYLHGQRAVESVTLEVASSSS